MTSHKWELLNILNHYAPNASAQEACAEICRQAEADGVTDRELDLILVSALVDGLRHGNWPWVIPWMGTGRALERDAGSAQDEPPPSSAARRAAEYKAAHENRVCSGPGAVLRGQDSRPPAKGGMYKVRYIEDDENKMFVLPFIGEGVGELEGVLHFGTKGLPSSMVMIRRSWIISIEQLPQ